MKHFALSVCSALVSSIMVAGCGVANSVGVSAPSPTHARSMVPTAIEFNPTHPRHGWLLARSKSTNILFHTRDDGVHWRIVWRSRRVIPQSIPQFLPSHQGWMSAVIGQHVTILTTTDGGRQWRPKTLGSGISFESLAFPIQNQSPFHWLMAEGYSLLGGSNTPLVLYRYDTRQHRWERIVPAGLARATAVGPLTGFSIQNPHTAWAAMSGNDGGGLHRIQIRRHHATVHAVSLPDLHPVGAHGIEPPVFEGQVGVVIGFVGDSRGPVTGRVWETDNGGATWKQTAEMPRHSREGRFATTRVGFAWNQTQWWYTRNSGLSWASSKLPAQIQQVDIVNPSNIWVIAASGPSSYSIYHSIDEGRQWAIQPTPSPAAHRNCGPKWQ